MKTLSLFVLCVWTLNASASSWQVLGDTHNSNNLKEATELLDSLAAPKLLLPPSSQQQQEEQQSSLQLQLSLSASQPLSDSSLSDPSLSDGLPQRKNNPPKDFFQDDDNLLVYYMKDTTVKDDIPNLIDQEEDQVYALRDYEGEGEDEGDEIGEEILFEEEDEGEGDEDEENEEDENQDIPPIFKNKDNIDFEDLYAATVFTDTSLSSSDSSSDSPVPDSPWPVDLSLKDEPYSTKGENEIELSQAVVPLTLPEDTPTDSDSIQSHHPYDTAISTPLSTSSSNLDGPVAQYDSAGHPITEHESEIERILESASVDDSEHYEEGGEEDDEADEDEDEDTPYADDAFPLIYDIPETSTATTTTPNSYEPNPHVYKPLFPYDVWVWGTCFIALLCIVVYRETKRNGTTEHWRHKSDKEEEKLPLHVKDLSHQPVPFSGVVVIDQAKSGSIDMPTNKGRRASLGHTHIIKHQQRPVSSHVRHMSLGSNSLVGRDHKQALWNDWKVVEEEDGENGW
ncbi:hypothetical protein F4703DRAFT_1823731 [Phycomyces blakesleeanus]